MGLCVWRSLLLAGQLSRGQTSSALWSGCRAARAGALQHTPAASEVVHKFEYRHSHSFACAALPDSNQDSGRGESEPSAAQSWLELEPRPRSQSAQLLDHSVLESTSTRSDEAVHEASIAEPRDTHLRPDDCDTEDDTLGPLDWSASESDSEQQTRFSPAGRRPKYKRSKLKARQGIGRPAVVPPLPDFDYMLPRLRAYKDHFGDCLVPKRYWQDYELGDWTSRIRNLLKDKALPPRQFDALDEMGFPWIVPIEVATWEALYHEMRRYKEEYGNLDVPFKWKDPMADFNNHFAKWFHAQPTLFLQRRLRPDQVRKLMIAGYDMQKVTGDHIGKADYVKAQKEVAMSGDKAEFEIMYAELEAWKETYYTTIVPRMVYDNPVLGTWAWTVRRAYRRKTLAQWKMDRLDTLEFLWSVDPQSAKWHHNLHEARRYKEVHGTGSIPVDYKNPAEPAWQEASRWLQRQAKLFRKQKLSDKRYRIMREVLGIKFVRQYAPRVKENRKRMGIQPGPAKRLPKYAPPMRKNVLV